MEQQKARTGRRKTNEQTEVCINSERGFEVIDIVKAGSVLSSSGCCLHSHQRNIPYTMYSVTVCKKIAYFGKDHHYEIAVKIWS